MSNSVLKLEIGFPEPESKEILDGQSRMCNWLYNFLIDKAALLKQEFCKNGDKEVVKTLYSKRGLRNLLPKIKEEHPFLKLVHSSVLKNVALRLSDSIGAHQKSRKGLRKGKKTGWPKYRSWKKNWFSLFYDEPTKGFVIEDRSLIISLGMGQDRKQRSLTFSLPDANLLKGKIIRNLRIVSELGEYYAIFTIKEELPATKPISKVIAIDPNHKNFGYGVDTDGNAIEIAAPTWLKKYDKRIDELKAKRDKCQKKSKKLPVLDSSGKATGKEFYIPSIRWTKNHKTLNRALRKRREQTKTFTFTIAHGLFQKYDCVGIGDYTPNGGGITPKMRRGMNNRSLNGRFKEVLSWVAQKSGKSFFIFDETGTTRTCCHCLHAVEGGIPLSIRIWQCSHCQAVHIRDENAAINGLSKVLRELTKKCETFVSPVSGSDLARIKERWAWCVLPSGVKVTPRGQNSDFYSQHQEIELRA